MYSIPTEAIFNVHPWVLRTTLVGVGHAGDRRPVIVVKPKPGLMPRGTAARDPFVGELRALAAGAEHPVTRKVDTFLFHPSLPADVRPAQLATSHWFQIDRARKDLGWEPAISTEEGLRRLFASYAGASRPAASPPAMASV